MDPNSPSSIAERLCADIRRGAIAAGAVLQQEELAARFGVSRQPVRLAMESLRAAGWLEPGKGRSLKVVEMTAEALRDLVAVRRLVEGEALALAMPRRDDRDVLEAGHLQERIEAETDPQALEELDAAFHTVLYRAGGNPRLLALVDELRREDRRPYREQQPDTAIRAVWTRQHRTLLDAFRAGDAVRAAAALDTHLAHLIER
ncbi:GntR family transcriptional regulator [Thalassobaculum sp. OXR-137]|uniref:GntR family transcriptional regulator n=1 Tax=Thalassobaculum sp. OXR-137 TaxID=3100173 RepID=UPI002AC99322|nr:GntR family transcriptional regulator [Thalassobaculum sp. OXR-137]WPZ34728.1 GntR family transcriptional regulator [Thalassobaculum sp. OXR-137]